MTVPVRKTEGAGAPGGSADLTAVLDFLLVRTPERWFQQALAHQDVLLIDHANCEKKAAGNALSLLYRYVDKADLLRTLSRLAREELRHFEQVHEHLEARGIDYVHVSASRYARELKLLIRTREPERLVDTLLMGAIVEARSCERFAGLAEVLPDDLASFYRKLLASEARHFQQYLSLAEQYAEGPIEASLNLLLAREAELVVDPDQNFRFHSGPLADS